jgi:hypothetical protein
MENDVDNNIIAIKQLLSKSINNDYFDYIKDIIDKNVNDCNLLYTQVCYLIKLFLLYDYENNNLNNDYDFNEIIIRFCFKLIRTNGFNCDKNLINNNLKYRLYHFFINYNLNINNDFKFICPLNLSSVTHITNALSRDIQTNITNNISLNYFKYLKEYININLKIHFQNSNDVINSNIISNVFNDIINNTFYSNALFHNWIREHKKLIIPNINNNVFIASIKDGIDNYYKLFFPFINKYIKNNDILINLIKINDEKNINKLLKSIYNDVINNTFETNIIYHNWIKENIALIINEFNKSNCIDFEKELNSKPFIFIPFMLFINKNLEINNSKKKYQIIPLRTNLTPKFIPINVHAFVDILDSKYLLGNIKNDFHNDTKKGLILFKTYFNFTSKYIKNSIKKGYIFSGLIMTNGYEIIFNFNSKLQEDKNNKYHSSGKKERKNIKDNTLGLSEEEINNFLIINTNKKNKEKKVKEILIKEKSKNNKELDKQHKNNKLNKIKNKINILK